jgi:uncharacterized membrane protein
MMEMRVTRDIARPAAEVFEFFSDASNNPLWQKGMRSCQWTSEPPIARGSTYTQHARFMGRDIRSTFVVTNYEAGWLIAIKSLESTFPIQVERRVVSTGQRSSQVSARIRGGPEGGLFKLLEPLMARMAQRSVDHDYDRLVEYLESDGRT